MLGRSRPRSPGPRCSQCGWARPSTQRQWYFTSAAGRGPAPPGQLPRLICGPGERHASMLHVISLLACAVTIYFACEWFVNAVEWLGVELKVGPLAVGTVLAAAGTALPESIVTLVAALFGGAGQGNDIAVGAAMGGPLGGGTIALCRTGGRSS